MRWNRPAMTALLFVLLPQVAVAACAQGDICLDPFGGAIAMVYDEALKVVGLAVFVMFMFAGLSYMLPGWLKPSWLGDPIKLMQDAAIGAVILLSAYIILSAINPDLVGGVQ